MSLCGAHKLEEPAAAAGSGMAKGTEEEIIRACKNRLRDEVAPALGPNHVSVSGVVLGIYEFLDNEVAGTPNYGTIYLANKAERMTVVQGKNSGDRGRIDFPYSRGANFWIHETGYREEDMALQGLKHNGLQNIYFTAYSVQLSKMVSASGTTSKTLASWLADIPIKTSTYFSHQEQNLLLTLYNCVEYIWDKGFTSDVLSDISSYRMIDHRIKLRPMVLRRRAADENNFLALKNDLATLLEVNFLPKWRDVEFQDFINFLRAPYSSTSSIHCFPIFWSPKRRQVLYRSYNVNHMSSDQAQELQARVQPPQNLTNTIAQPQFFVVRDIFTSHNIKSNSVYEALRLAYYVSAHYVQRLKELKKDDWQQYLADDTVDKFLKECMPGLLTKRYALEEDPAFHPAPTPPEAAPHFEDAPPLEAA